MHIECGTDYNIYSLFKVSVCMYVCVCVC